MSLQIQPKPEEPKPELDVQIELLTWLEENKKTLAIGFGVVAAAVVFLIVQRNMAAQAEAAADKALFRTLADAGPASGGPAAEVLLRHAGGHSGTRSAERAHLLASAKLFEEGKYADARKAFDDFNQAHPDSPFGATATLGVASALDAMDKGPEALAAYQAFIAGYATDVLADRARLAKARLHGSLGQPREALALYDEISRGGFNEAAQEAAMLRAALLQAHPDLAPPPQVLTNAVNVQPAVPVLTPSPAGK